MKAKGFTLSSRTLRNLRLGAVAVSVALTIILVYAVFQSYNSYSRDTAELRGLEKELAKLQSDYEGLEQLLKQYAQEQEKFKQLLFNEQDVPLFLEEISRFALDAQVKIVDMKTRTFARVNYAAAPQTNKPVAAAADPGKEKPSLVLSYLPIQVKFQGAFDQIVNFLWKLERYKQLITLSDVEIKVKEYPQLECQLVVNIYSLKEMNAENK